MGKTGITLGVFDTETPERFGVIRAGQVVNKQPGEAGQAWGMLGWDLKVRNRWLSATLTTYTDAINHAMCHGPYHKVEMAYYHDMASWHDYRHFVAGWQTVSTGA